MESLKQTLKQDIVLEMIAISLRDRTNINPNRKRFYKKNFGNKILTLSQMRHNKKP
jgi:hypothetical protein